MHIYTHCFHAAALHTRAVYALQLKLNCSCVSYTKSSSDCYYGPYQSRVN